MSRGSSSLAIARDVVLVTKECSFQLIAVTLG